MSGVPPFQWENDLSAIVGLTISEFRFAVSFFLSVFISWCWRFVPTSQGRHLYAVVTGFCLIYYPFGNGSKPCVVHQLLLLDSMPCVECKRHSLERGTHGLHWSSNGADT
ncbi:hypothetical protein WJX77_006867 [Trebouxia sp. C0004]